MNIMVRGRRWLLALIAVLIIAAGLVAAAPAKADGRDDLHGDGQA